MPRLTRRAFTTGLAALAAWPARAASGTVTLSGPAFGTTWQVTLPDRATGPLERGIETLLARIDAGMSPWRPDSLLSTLNALPEGRTEVTPDFAHVLRAAQHLHAASQGAFDPGVGPAVAHWGFGPIAEPAAPGHFTLTGTRLTKHGAPTLDLCGIAKGHALDRVSALLHAQGHPDHLIEIGGELLASGWHPANRPWRVGVEDPRPGIPGLATTLPLTRAIATSGIKTQSYALGPRTYSHIIDPRDMAPARTGTLLSVSVLAATAMEADGWATALMAAGPDRGPHLARRHALDALFLHAAPGGLRPLTTGRAG